VAGWQKRRWHRRVLAVSSPGLPADCRRSRHRL